MRFNLNFPGSTSLISQTGNMTANKVSIDLV